MIKEILIVVLINGCNENFSMGVKPNDAGNPDRVLFYNTSNVDSNVSIQAYNPISTKMDSSIPIQKKDTDSSIPAEAEIHESGVDSVQPKEQRDSGSKDSTVSNHHDSSSNMVDGSADSHSDSGRPDCDDETLEGCAGVYGQPCRTYRLPPYKCVCLLNSEDCVLK
jgi:hypothetical protein